MDVIAKVVKDTFGKNLFKSTDNKTLRVNRMLQQLKQMPELLQYTSEEDDNQTNYYICT